MTDITIYKYGLEPELLKRVSLDTIPRVGEFIIMEHDITPDWKSKMYTVRAVSTLLSGKVIIHVSKYDMDKEIKDYNEMKDTIKGLLHDKDKRYSESTQTQEACEIRKSTFKKTW